MDYPVAIFQMSTVHCVSKIRGIVTNLEIRGTYLRRFKEPIVKRSRGTKIVGSIMRGCSREILDIVSHQRETLGRRSSKHASTLAKDPQIFPKYTREDFFQRKQRFSESFIQNCPFFQKSLCSTETGLDQVSRKSRRDRI